MSTVHIQITDEITETQVIIIGSHHSANIQYRKIQNALQHFLMDVILQRSTRSIIRMIISIETVYI